MVKPSPVSYDYKICTYSSRIKTMFGLMNSTASLSSQCVAAHDYKCLFAPIAIAFITTPIFALNSEYDASVRLFSFSSFSRSRFSSSISPSPPARFVRS